VNNEAETNWSDLFKTSSKAVKEALGLVAQSHYQLSALTWIPVIKLHKYSHVSQGNAAKAPLHTRTDTNHAATPSQASSVPGLHGVLCAAVHSRSLGIPNMYGACTVGCGRALSLGYYI